jgi:hypothetical protein
LVRRDGAAGTLTQPLPATTLDETTVFRGGVVYTVDGQRPWAQAVAVRGRKIDMTMMNGRFTYGG